MATRQRVNRSPVTIERVIRKMGGPQNVAKEMDLSLSLVRKWPKIGIQWWHWPKVIEHTGYRVSDLFAANVMAAGGHHGVKKLAKQAIEEKH